jgi:hypothetical protein
VYTYSQYHGKRLCLRVSIQHSCNLYVQTYCDGGCQVGNTIQDPTHQCQDAFVLNRGAEVSDMFLKKEKTLSKCPISTRSTDVVNLVQD